MQADTTISPTQSRPVEFPQGNNFYKPESQASGGDRFQNHRLFRTFAYAMNCVRTESGFSSVESKKIDAQEIGDGKHTNLSYLTDSFGEVENLVAFDPEFYYVSGSIKGSLVIPKECERILISNGTVEGYSHLEPIEVTALLNRHQDLKGVMRAHYSTIWWTKSHLYYDSFENALDYTPSMRTGAGTLSPTADIGAIVTVVSNRKGIYVFGTSGAIYGAITRDVKYPFDFKPVVNHDGILHKASVTVGYEADDFMVMSHTGLQDIRGESAKNVYPDISRALKRGININIVIQNMETGYILAKGSKPNEFLAQARDEYRDVICQRGEFYEEFVGSSGKSPHVKVNNISPRYTLISYARVNGEFHRLLVIDQSLNTSSVLHIRHVDTIRPRFGYNELFIYSTKEGVYKVQEGGEGLLLFMEFQKSNARSITFSRAVAYGRFDRIPINECSDGIGIPFIKGLDQINSDILNYKFHLVGQSQREVTYAGRITDKILTFAVPFRGTINEIVFDYK